MHPQCGKCIDKDNLKCIGSYFLKDFGEECPHFRVIQLHSESDKISEEKNSQNLKSTNPKDLIGSDKLPFHLVPASAIAYECLAFLEGALKYGRSNWRAAGVRFSIYYDACLRHLTKCIEGEWIDSESGIPHLGHARACLGIIIDAYESGMLKDDRMYSKSDYTALITKYSGEVKRLKEKYKDKNPKQWTILDNEEEEK